MKESRSPTNTTKCRSRTISTNSQASSTLDDHSTDFDTTLDDAEMAELGLSHELVGDEMYLPSHPSRDWIRCFVSTSGTGCYRFDGFYCQHLTCNEISSTFLF